MKLIHLLTRSVLIGLAVTTIKQAQAAPYASGLVNNAGSVSFFLNEAADDVKVIYGTTTNSLGAMTAGAHSTTIGSSGTFSVAVTKSAGAGYKTPVGTFAPSIATAGKIQISTDAPLLKFNTPRGVAVNKNPASPFFGRIYAANSTPATTGRLTGRGLYTLNPDFTDSSNGYGDNAQTGGLTFAVSANSPYRISVGQDGYLYISDYSDANANVYRTDGNLQNGEWVLDVVGGPGTLPAGQNHGSVLKVMAEGSLVTGDLTIYTIDEDYGSSLNNDLWKYSIGSGPLTNQNLPTGLSSLLIGGASVNDDFCKGGTNNYIYLMQNRSAPASAPVVYILDSNGVQVNETRALWRTFTGNASATDVLTNLQSIAVSPDGKYLAAITQGTGNSDTFIIPLTNGIPDFSRLALLDTGTVTQGRGIDFDAAGNLYIISSGDTYLRAFAPGGTTTATTGSDGTFAMAVPATTVSVSTTTTNISEGGGTNGVFTISRTGDTSSALTVNYTISGTASNSVDFAALSGSVTLAAGATSTNVFVTPTNDSITETTETAILTIVAGSGYDVSAPASATISIMDDETPEISLSSTQSIMLEAFSGSKATFQITRKGLLSSALTVNLGYTGSAVRGSRYNAPATASVAANATTGTFTATPINNAVVDGNQTAVVTITSGTGYVIATNNSVTATIIDEDVTAGPVLFSDTFDSDTSPNWTINYSDGGADSFALFGYNYAPDGIPPAPHTTDSSTTGLKFRVNETLSNVVAVTTSPVGQNFTGDYRLTFDMWINYNGPLATGGTGSTESLIAGVGSSGDRPNWQNNLGSEGSWFSVAGDGGNGVATGDYNAYIGGSLLGEISGAYTAGTNSGARDNFNAYYAPWGDIPAPALQITNFPAKQTGLSPIGSVAFAWHFVNISKLGNVTTWSIDGRTIATVTNDLFANNIFIGLVDQFASKSDTPTLSFGLVDNVKVESLVVLPTITSIQLIGSDVQIDFTAAAGDSAGSFVLLGSSSLSNSNAAYTAEAGASIVDLGSGTFRATVPASGDTHFYRIQR